jgi:hypothetical protein
MNRIVLTAIIAAVAMSGCAPVHYAKADLDGLIVCNPDAMDQVERQAKRKFAQVIWMRCPTATLRVI